MKPWAAVCALSFAVLVTKVVIADEPGIEGAPIPREIPCSKDTDCAGCQRCTGGFCPNSETQQKICMCNAECTEAGTVCDVSEMKPLCGGTCVKATAKRELTCGAGDDVVVIESLQTPISDRADGVKLMAGNPVSITLLEVPK